MPISLSSHHIAPLNPLSGTFSTNDFAKPANCGQAIYAPPGKKPRVAVDQQLYNKIISNYNAGNLTKNIALETGALKTTIKRLINNYRSLCPVVIKARAPPKGKPLGKSEALPIMRRILERHPFTSVAQLARQLSNHGIYVTERGAQYYMSGIVVSVTLMSNQVAHEPALGELDPYNAAITSLIDSNLMPAGTNVVYLAYYKVTFSFQDFWTTRKIANKTPWLPVRCTIKGVFIAVSKSGILQYTAGENSESGYLYGTALAKLLEDYVAEAGRVTFTISNHMEGRHVVEDKLLSQNHNVVMYLANHTDLHLGDVIFSTWRPSSARPKLPGIRMPTSRSTWA